MHPKTYNTLLRRLRQIEAKSGKCKSKYLTKHTLKPNTMYQSDGIDCQCRTHRAQGPHWAKGDQN